MAQFGLKYYFAKDHFLYEDADGSTEREAAAVATRKMTSTGEQTVMIHHEGQTTVIRKEAILYCEVVPRVGSSRP